MCLQDADSPEKALLFAADAERLLADPEAGKNGADLHNALARLARADYPAFVKLLDAHLPSASEDLRRTLLGILAYQLRGDHAAECESKLNEIATASTNEAIKKMISDCIAENNARKRAQEPMATAPAPGKEAAR